jgi:hypothetical protein
MQHLCQKSHLLFNRSTVWQNDKTGVHFKKDCVDRLPSSCPRIILQISLDLRLDLDVKEDFSAYDVCGIVAFLWYWISPFVFKILRPSLTQMSYLPADRTRQPVWHARFLRSCNSPVCIMTRQWAGQSTIRSSTSIRERIFIPSPASKTWICGPISVVFKGFQGFFSPE